MIAQNGNMAQCLVNVIKSKISASEVTSSMYGEKVVNYTHPASARTWRIFHADSDNIYLISDDYIKQGEEPKKNGETIIIYNYWIDKHSLNFNPNELESQYPNGLASISSLNTNIINKWFKKYSAYYNGNYSNSTEGMRTIAYMLDTEIWNGLFRGADAEYAIGGPTLEMFIASWNVTHPTRRLDCIMTKCHVWYGDYIGYAINDSASGSNDYVSYIEGLPNNDFNNIYFKSNGVSTQRLASPIASESSDGQNFGAGSGGELGAAGTRST